jgi:hypothetical protein
MLWMNSRCGVVMSVLVMVAGLAVAEEASAQEATRKATTHKGTAKRSLVKQSAPVQTADGSEGGTKPPSPKEALNDTTPTSVPGNDMALPVPRAPAALAPKARAEPATPAAKPAPSAPAAPVAKPSTRGTAASGATGATTAGAAAPGAKVEPTEPAPSLPAPATPQQPAAKAPEVFPSPDMLNLAAAPGAENLASGRDAKGSSGAPAAGGAAATPAKPLAPKTSGVRRPVTAKTVGTNLAAAPTNTATSSSGATNRVTDPRPVSKPKPVVTSGSSSAERKSPATSGTATPGGAATKPAQSGTTTTASKTTGPAASDAAIKPADGRTTGRTTGGSTVANGGTSSSGTSTGSTGSTSGSSSETAAPTPETFAVRPKALPSDPKSARFRALAWSPVSVDGVDFVAPFVWAGLPGSPVASDPVAIAQQLLQRPEGQRVLCFWDVLYELADHPLDRIQTPDGKTTEIRSPFMDRGIEATAQRVSSILAGIKRAGATVDVLVLDYERGFAWDPRFASLDNDPRWFSLARNLGFENLRGMDAARIARWNEVMGRYFDDAIARSTDQPLQSVFPGARLANFDSFASTPMAPVIGSDGVPFLRASVTDRNGTLIGLGSHDSSPFFGVLLPTTAQQRADGMNPIGQDAFSAARLELHRSRAMRKPAGRSQMPWIAPRSLDVGAVVARAEPGTAAPMRSTPYWDEMVLQLGLHGADDFLYWNPEGELAPQAPVAALPEDHQALDGLLEELNRNLGQQPGDSVYREQPGFDDRILATGRDDGESIVWRFTFDPSIESARVFFTDGTSLVVNREADRPGAWIAHPRSKSLVFDADNTAPVFEVVAARTSGSSGASTRSPNGSTTVSSGDSTGAKQAVSAGSTGTSGESTGAAGAGTGSAGGGSTVAAGSGGDAGGSTGPGSGAPRVPTRSEIIAAITSETRQRASDALANVLGGRRTTNWTGGLSYSSDRWQKVLIRASTSPGFGDAMGQLDSQAASMRNLDPRMFVRPLSVGEIHPDQYDTRADNAGGNRDVVALAFADANQSSLLRRMGTLLAVSAARSNDPALIARANEMLVAFLGHTPLQRPGRTLANPGVEMPAGGDGVWLATVWGMEGIMDMMTALGDRIPAELRADLELLLRQEVRNICVDWADARPWFVRVGAANSNQWIELAAILVKACLFLKDDSLLPAYNLGVESLAASLAKHGADGAYLEGFSYGASTIGTIFDVLAEMQFNGDNRCAESPFTRNSWKWLLHNVMPGQQLVNCFDSGWSMLPTWGRSAPMAHIGVVSEVSGSDALSSCAWMFPNGRGDLPGVRYLGALKGVQTTPRMMLPTYAYFPSQQLVTWRSAWERPSDRQSALGIWVRGGALGEDHGHRDQGQVSVYKGDRPILIDCGSDYYNPNQETMLAPVVGHGIMQVGALSPPFKAISAPIVVSRLDEQAGSVLVDSTAAYEGVVSCKRTVQWDISGRVNLGDTVQFRDRVAAGTEVYRFHTGSTLPLEISGGGMSWQVRWGDATMTISADRDIVVDQVEWPDAVLPGKMHRAITIRSVDALESMAMTSMLEVAMP